MALVVKDRVKETTATTGTGTLTLAGAVAGFRAFSAALSDGDTTYYALFESSTGEWEVGLGTFTLGSSTLARTTILASSNAGSAINLTAGSAEVFITQPAGKTVVFDAAGGLTLNQDPTGNLQAATKQYVDTIAAAGLHYHDPVRVEEPTALTVTYNNGTAGVGATLTNAGTQAALVLDGVTMNVADRVLIYQQADATQNGIYTVTNVGSGSTNWVLTRATDADSYGPSDPDSLGQGDAFFVLEGNTGAGELYVMNTEGTITFGTTNITFTQVASTAVYSAGNGLTLTGTTFAVGAGAGVTVNANDVSIGQDVSASADVAFNTVTASLLGNATTATTASGVTANSVALGTDTTGNYVAAGAVSGSGLSGSASSEGATFTVTSNATNANTPSTIVFRDGSGNFSAGTITANAAVLTTADINGGTIDGTVIGGSTPAAISGTTGQFGTSLNVDGTVTADGLTVARAGGAAGSGNVAYIDVTSSFGGLSINSSAGNNAFIEFLENGVKTAGFNSDAAANVTSLQSANGHALAFNTDGTTERLRITSTGNVGIGTSSFAYSAAGRGLLEVNGSSSALVGLKIGDVAGGYLFDSGSLVSIGAPAGRSITFDINGERARIDASGNVGIGTVSPSSFNSAADNLVVGTTSGDNGITIATGTANQGSLFFADGTASGAEQAAGYLIYLHNTNAMAFGTSNTERLRIDASGNVNLTGLSNGTLNFAGGNTSGGSKIQAWNDAGNANGYLAIEGYSSEYIRIDASGNLLVGKTSAAGADINVVGNVLKPTGANYFTATSDGSIFNRLTTDGTIIDFRKNGTTVGSIGSTGGTGEVYIANNDSVGLKFTNVDAIVPSTHTGGGANRDAAIDLGYSSGGTNVRFKDLYLSGGLRGDTTFKNNAGTTEYARFDSSGNLGIGTSSPSEKLEVAADANSRIKNQEIGGNSSIWLQQAVSSYLIADSDWRFYTNSLERAVIDASGNVGIGTVSPASKLHVKSTADNIVATQVSTNTVNALFQSIESAGLAQVGTTGAHPFTFFTANQERMRITSTGSVGIGTSSPSEKLDVSGVTLSSSIQEGYTALSGTTPSIDADVAGSFALTTSGDTTFTFSAVPSGRTVGFILKITAGGAHTITWPASVDWAGGTAPDAPASGETDVLVFYTVDGGTTWYGVLSVDAAA
jgi:hypothetical protein